MTDTEKALVDRIRELQDTAQKARLEPMQIAGALLAKENALLGGARSNQDPAGDLAALRARYDMLVRTADDAQAAIDRLHAEQHDERYYR